MKRRIIALMLLLFLCIACVSAPAHAAGGSTAKVYEWSQMDSRWKKIYNKNWGYGCAVTAVAVQIARTDLVRVDEKATEYNPKTGEGFNPGTFAKLMKLGNQLAIGDYDVSGWIPGFKVATDSKYYKPSKIKFNYYPAKSKQDIVDAMKYFLDQGYYPVIEGPGSTWTVPEKKGVHYVAVIETTKDDVKVIDPSDGKKKSLFSVSLGGNKWTVENIEKCGIPKGYGCCRLYKVDPSKLLNNDVTTLTAKEYLSCCEETPTYCIVQETLSQNEYIKSLPCSVLTNENSETIRPLKNGEYFTAVAILKNTAGNYWYKVYLSGGSYGYIYCGTTKFVDIIEELPVFKDAEFSKTTYGKSFPMTGTISTKYTRIAKITGEIKDSAGKTQTASDSCKKKSYKISAGKIDANLKFAKLSKGDAKITFTVEMTVYYCTDGQTMKSTNYTDTYSWNFKVR